MEDLMGSREGRRGLVVVVLFGFGLSVGCGGSSATAPPPGTPASAAADDEASGLMEHHRYHHHGGVTLFIAMSLDTLGVSPEQRTAVEKVRANLYAELQAARSEEHKLLTALADGLVAASFDTPAVDAAAARVTEAAAAAQDASAGALNELHGILTPVQRAALVDKVEAHWAVWQEANAGESGGAKTAENGRLSTLTRELGLTADQVDKIRANLADGTKAAPRRDPQAIASRLNAFGDAFRSETFDARALQTGTASSPVVEWGAAGLARFVEAASSVLTQDQRAKLAQKLREHAAHDPNAQVNP
jgi:Spy/CpxP family protein refolding chaperone